MATQNPIESEGTYPLPEAQIDRFMLKVVVGYPSRDEELTVVQRSLVAPAVVRQVLELESLKQLQRAVLDVYVDPSLVAYAVSLAEATRNPAAVGLAELAGLIEYGASPRGPIALVQSARALALIHGRDYVLGTDLRALAKDALRHRLVLTYRALAEQRTADDVLDAVLASGRRAAARAREAGRRVSRLAGIRCRRDAGAPRPRADAGAAAPRARALDRPAGRRPPRGRASLAPARPRQRARPGAPVRARATTSG